MKLKQRAKTIDRETKLKEKNARKGARAILGNTHATKIKWASLHRKCKPTEKLLSVIETKPAQIKENRGSLLLNQQNISEEWT